MEGIHNVVQDPEFVRIELEVGFYITLNKGGAIVGHTWDEEVVDQSGRTMEEREDHAHLDWEAADQIARTIQSWKA